MKSEVPFRGFRGKKTIKKARESSQAFFYSFSISFITLISSVSFLRSHVLTFLRSYALTPTPDSTPYPDKLLLSTFQKQQRKHSAFAQHQHPCAKQLESYATRSSP